MLDTTRPLKNFATLHPLLFAFLCWAVVMAMLALSGLFLPVYLGVVLVQVFTLLFAVGMLARLGWLREAGFRRPVHWRDLLVLWPAVLFTLITMVPIVFVLPQITGLALVPLALLPAVLAGLNEEALCRGLLLRALQPYGLLSAAVISALFFSLLHLNNLFHEPLMVTLPQLGYAFLLGFAYAALRLRTRVIWPLMIMHTCNDIATQLSVYATPSKSVDGGGSMIRLLVSTLLLVALTLALALYGFFVLRAQKRSEHTLESVSHPLAS